MKELYTKFWKADEKHSFTGWESKLYFYLLKLADDSDELGVVHISDIKLASIVGMSRNTFKPCRSRLVSAGLVSFTEGGKGYGSKTSYCIFEPKKQREEPKKVSKSRWILAIELNRPFPFNQPEFDTAWSDWCKYADFSKLRERNQVGFDHFFKELAELSNSDLGVASQIIYQSIGRGWKRIFPLANNQSNAKFGENSAADYRKNTVDGLRDIFNGR